MWNRPQGRFNVGTTSDGVTLNAAFLPEDVNSWSYLAFRDPAYQASVSWDVRNLAARQAGPASGRSAAQGAASGYGGVSSCTGDRTGVWFEGTAHLADALEARNGPGDAARAAGYLSDIYHAQVDGPNADGAGIIAASKDGLSDCAGGVYYASLHTGTTAWYILAARRADPFSLIFGG